MTARKKAEPELPAVLSSPYETPEGTMKFETANGVIEYKIPLGELGLLHFDLIYKASPKDLQEVPLKDENGEPIMDEETGEYKCTYVPSLQDVDNMEEARKEWIRTILPKVAISPPFDQMRGEDQNLCFRVALESVRINTGELFRPC